MAAGNTALLSNPPTNTVEHITTHGSDWLWAVFAIMFFSDIVVFAWHLTLPRGQRAFHQLSMFILTTAGIAYFLMASDLGFTPINTEFAGVGEPLGVARQIWYVRYIDWVITTPALLLTLALASGLPLMDIATLIYFDLVMIITGLVGALIVSQYKWALFTFGCVALFYIWWVLAGPARTSAYALSPQFGKTFIGGAAYLSFVWLLYPIAWGLADGGNIISPDSEMVFYGILDVVAKPIFCFYHLFMLSRLDLSMLQLQSGKWSVSGGPSGGATGAYDAEKTGRFGNATSTTGGYPGGNTRDTAHTHAARDAVIGAGIGGAAEHHHEKRKANSGMFSRKGKYDAAAPPSAVGTAPIQQVAPNDTASVVTDPRPSGATAVSR